jgi:hypothetical protein
MDMLDQGVPYDLELVDEDFALFEGTSQQRLWRTKYVLTMTTNLLEVSTDLPEASGQLYWLKLGFLDLEGCQVTPSGFLLDTLRSHSSR